MEVDIIKNLEGNRAYLQLQASGNEQEQARFDIYVIDESMAKNSEGTPLSHSYLAFGRVGTPAHYQLQDTLTNTLNTFYAVGYRFGGVDHVKYISRGELGDSTTTEDDVKSVVVDLLSIEGWENNQSGPFNNNGRNTGGWNQTLNRWFPHASVEGGTETIGRGHKLTAAEASSRMVTIGGAQHNMDNGLTDAQVLSLLESDVEASYTAAVNSLNTTTECGDWNTLEFWAKVLYVELVFNRGSSGVAEYVRLRTSFRTRNYGTSGIDPETGDPLHNMQRDLTTFGEYRRGWYVGEHIPANFRFSELRHEFIHNYILKKLELYRRPIGNQAPNSFSPLDECTDPDETPEQTAELPTACSVDCPTSSPLDYEDSQEVNMCEYTVEISDDTDVLESFEIMMIAPETGICECVSDVLVGVELNETCDGGTRCDVDLGSAVFVHTVNVELVTGQTYNVRVE